MIDPSLLLALLLHGNIQVAPGVPPTRWGTTLVSETTLPPGLGPTRLFDITGDVVLLPSSDALIRAATQLTNALALLPYDPKADELVTRYAAARRGNEQTRPLRRV